jgi:hypothetical protein
MTFGPYHEKELTVDNTYGAPSVLVVPWRVVRKYGPPIEKLHGIDKINAVIADIALPFVFVPLELHSYHNRIL